SAQPLRAGAAFGGEAGRLPHPRPSRGGAQEIWPGQGTSQLPVLEALIVRSTKFCRGGSETGRPFCIDHPRPTGSSTVQDHRPRSPSMRLFILLVLPLPVLLSGCLARTAVNIATLPVKAASAGVDAVTTSQAEADQRRGRQ